MSTNQRPVVLLIAVLLGGITITSIGWLRGRNAVAEHDRLLDQQRRTAVSGISELHVVPFRDAREVAAAFFAPTPRLDGDVPTTIEQASQVAEENARLWNAAVEFLERRYGTQASADEYSQWMHSRGFSLRPKQELINTWWAAEAYEAYVGRPPADGLSAQELFLASAAGADVFRDGSVKPVAVAVDPEWVGFQSGVISAAAPTLGSPATWPERVLALTGRKSTSRSWFEVPDPDGSGLERNATARAAEVWCVAEFASGERRPMSFGLVYVPHSREWVVTRVTVGCLPGEESVRCEF